MKADRFWSLVGRGEGEDPCWPWRGSRQPKGYAVVRITLDDHSTAVTTVGRVAWLLSYGEIPAGLQVGHACADRLCCNPEHLYLEEPAGEGRHPSGRGRTPHRGKRDPVGLARGERHGLVTVTDAGVKEARERINRGESSNRVAKDMGVSAWTVRAWAAGNVRREAGGPLQKA